MTDYDLINDDDEFLEALVDEALADDGHEEGLKFTHAFVSASVEDVVRAIRSGLSNASAFECRIFGTGREMAKACVFLSEKENGTLLWMPQECLRIAAAVSRELHQPVHWISVFESFTSRAYIRFEDGQCVQEVLDPESYWTQNIMNGDDLIGNGARRFRDYGEFIDSLTGVYEPKDTTFDFERMRTCANERCPGIGGCKNLLQLDIALGTISVTFLGIWPQQRIWKIQNALE